MNINIHCMDGIVFYHKNNIVKLSKVLSDYFSDDVCQCHTSVIIPDVSQELVTLAITLLDGVVWSDVELSTDLLQCIPCCRKRKY